MFRKTLAVLLLGASPLAAQTTGDPRTQLHEAIRHYEKFNIEAAMPMLRSAIRMESALSRAEAANAFKYLGAIYALMDRRDSAVVLFREALRRDSSLVLDPRMFAKVEIEAFEAAKTRSGKP